MRARSTSLVAALVLPALLLGCGHHVGDPCSSNVECSALGDRFCDIASPGGYCTVEGCDNTSCPGGSVCVRFFTPLPDKPCNPETAKTDCLPSERCLCDCGSILDPGKCALPSISSIVDGGNIDGGGEGILVSCTTAPITDPAIKGGHCAPESTERRWCQMSCGNSGNCRTGYECRATGSSGSTAVPEFIDDGGVQTGPPSAFCVAIAR